MAIQPFAATGSPSITVPGTKQLIVETLSVQVDVTPPGTKLEAFVNYTSGGENISLFVPLTYGTRSCRRISISMSRCRRSVCTRTRALPWRSLCMPPAGMEARCS